MHVLSLNQSLLGPTVPVFAAHAGGGALLSGNNGVAPLLPVGGIFTEHSSQVLVIVIFVVVVFIIFATNTARGKRCCQFVKKLIFWDGRGISVRNSAVIVSSVHIPVPVSTSATSASTTT